MDVDKFAGIATLVCEPARAKMLWNLLDGKAYTAGELAIAADISATAASNHLSKLLEAGLLQAERDGRRRYFSFARPEVAYVIESLASLSGHSKTETGKPEPSGIKYCRSCYDHLAGYVGVHVTETMERNKCIRKLSGSYTVTAKGWELLCRLDIHKEQFENKRRPLTRQCLDWSERRPHLAGQVGALLLDKMLEKNWFRRVKFSRELVVTPKGKNGLYELLRIVL